MPKPIQIAAAPASEGFHGALLFALCDDGHIYEYFAAGQHWVRLPEILGYGEPNHEEK